MLVHCVPLKAMLLNGNLGQSGIMEQALLHVLLEVLVSLFSGVQVLVLHALVHGLQTGDALQSVLFVKGLIHKVWQSSSITDIRYLTILALTPVRSGKESCLAFGLQKVEKLIRLS